MSVNEQRIRELAYQIWESEGCPHGEDDRHWEMACRLAEAEQGTATPISEPIEKAASRTRKVMPKPGETTTLEDSLGTPLDSGTSSVLEMAEAPVVKPAKPRASRTRTTAAAPKAPTDAEAGTPETIKKTRAPRASKKKEI
ncbi:DUF2934 domain-containing protein [Stutzerimonas tarimensis]|uniref:DUF2934 domain-containing protein n=1 Tax=Stutzerimonas tarimensis TaxID=1507735 RepID=A0ABV7T4A0_9GAMM